MPTRQTSSIARPLPAQGPGAQPVPSRPREVKKPSGHRWRWIGATAIVLVLGLVALFAWHTHASATAAAATEAAQIVTADIGNVEKSVNASGTVVANLEVDIKCRASGEVVALPFDISQTVKKGDLLCQLDPTDENLAIRSAQASVAQSTAKLEQARDNLNQATDNLKTTRQREESALASAKVKAANLQAKADRQKQLVAQQLGSQEDYETAQTDAAAAAADARSAEIAIDELKQQEIQLEYKQQDVVTAEAQLQADQINLDTQKQQLAYTTVTAPIDGTVSALDVQLGTIVASGTSAFNGGTTIMTLSDLSHIFVTASVDQSDMGDVKVGQAARITVDSYPTRSFAGKVVRIGVKGNSASNVVTFEVKVEVTDEHKDLLKPQMTGNVTIVEETRENVLTLSSSAVTHENGQTFVTLPGGKTQPVTLGLEGEELVEITSGLHKGDRLIAGAAEPASQWKSQDKGGPR